MLASSFLSADALGITEPERQVLIEFQRRAAAGEIPEEMFDMYRFGSPQCGTPGCIVGHMRTIDAAAASGLVRKAADGNRPLCKLFVGNAPHRTPSAAAEATWRYLTTGRV